MSETTNEISTYEKDLKIKIDEIFGFNLLNSNDGISYNFGQYKLNQIYRPLVNYFVKEFTKTLGEMNKADADQVMSLFIDFFKMYYCEGDFGYFMNKYSSFEYRIPYGVKYSGDDTELWWSSKNCYYVKTSDVVNNTDLEVPTDDLSTKNIKLFFRKITTEPNSNGKYDMSIELENLYDNEENLVGYNVLIYNRSESKSKKSDVKFILAKLKEKRIEAGSKLTEFIENFVDRRGRDYFIHKNLGKFLKGELDWYIFKTMGCSIKGMNDIYKLGNELEDKEGDIIIQKGGKDFSIYETAKIWCNNFINILADLEDFKAKLWTKKRKVIRQEYCISLGKIKELENVLPKREEILKYIFENEKQIKEWKELGMSANPSVDNNGLVVDTRNFEGIQRENLINLVKEEDIIGRLYNSDNFQLLKYLEDYYPNKIDCIYIDPPYNTDNDGFCYKDGYKDSSRINMIHERLSEARKLLNEKGIIFISIDDREQSQLKFVCDDVFGKENFLATIHRRKNKKPHNAGNTMSVSYEFLHVYVNKDKIKLCQDYAECKSDEFGEYAEYPIVQADKKERTYIFKAGIKCYCDLKKGRTTSARTEECNVTILDDPIIKDGILQNDIKVIGRYRLTDEGADKKLTTAMNEGRIFFNSNGIPKEKRYRTDEDRKVDTNYWEIEDCENGDFADLFKDYEELFRDIHKGKNEDGNDELNSLFGISYNNLFSYPKPVNLIKKVARTIDNKKAIILDFFAGSGTTGQAVMSMNKEDEGHRKFIEVELGKYFNDVTLVRTKKALYSQNWESGNAKDNDGTQGIIEYSKLNQYEDWFSSEGYLSLLSDDINKLSNLEGTENITQILGPLNEIKDRLYHIDETLSVDELYKISNKR